MDVLADTGSQVTMIPEKMAAEIQVAAGQKLAMTETKLTIKGISQSKIHAMGQIDIDLEWAGNKVLTRAIVSNVRQPLLNRRTCKALGIFSEGAGPWVKVKQSKWRKCNMAAAKVAETGQKAPSSKRSRRSSDNVFHEPKSPKVHKTKLHHSKQQTTMLKPERRGVAATRQTVKPNPGTGQGGTPFCGRCRKKGHWRRECRAKSSKRGTWRAVVHSNAVLAEAEDVRKMLDEEYGECWDNKEEVLTTMDCPPMKLELKEGAVPKAVMGARPIPYADKPKVKAELDVHVRRGVVRPLTDEYTEWLSQLHYVPKPHREDIRLVSDLKDLNEAIKRPIYLSSTPKEALSKVDEGAKWFTVLDLASGYHQIALDEDSQLLTAFVTPWAGFAIPVQLWGCPRPVTSFVCALINCLQSASIYQK